MTRYDEYDDGGGHDDDDGDFNMFCNVSVILTRLMFLRGVVWDYKSIYARFCLDSLILFGLLL